MLPAIQIVLLASCSIGILGGVYIIVSFMLFPPLRHHSSRLISLSSACDIVANISWGLTPWSFSSNPVCLLQAFLSQCFLTCSFLYMDCLGLSALRVVFTRKSTRALEILYHCISMPISAIIALSLLFSGQYGPAGDNGCWIKSESSALRIAVYAFTESSIVWNGAVAFCLFWKSRKMRRRSVTEGNLFVARVIENVESRFLRYMILFALCWIWGFANRLTEYITGHSVLWLSYLQVILEPLVPLFNAILFELGTSVHQHYFRRFPWMARLFGCGWQRSLNPWMVTMSESRDLSQPLRPRPNR